jgi:hypothetical protein
MLIDLVAVGSACFPGLASIPNSEKIHSSAIFGTLSKGINGTRMQTSFSRKIRRDV